MDINLIGCLAEYRFAVMAMEHEISVSFPLLDSSPYDCITDSKKGLKKVQIKSVSMEGEKVRCYTRNSKGESYKVKDVDIFAIWVKSHNGFYIFKNDGKTSSIIVSRTNKNSKKFNNFALL